MGNLYCYTFTSSDGLNDHKRSVFFFNRCLSNVHALPNIAFSYIELWKACVSNRAAFVKYEYNTQEKAHQTVRIREEAIVWQIFSSKSVAGAQL